MSFSGLTRINRPARLPEAQEWLDREAEEQRELYARIAHDMNVEMAAQRDEWIEAFHERIQRRGFNVHSSMLRKIKPEEIYPKRDYKVVF
jgi:hypothetical protein